MSLNVQHLNADTTFLLSFSPAFDLPVGLRPLRSAFNILLDPWLAGQSSILHPSFQVSDHTTEPAVRSLAELHEEVDLILVSQDKPDHCHRETLCSLPKSKRIPILATEAAAKKIRSWMHFDDDLIHELPLYSARDSNSIVKIDIPAYTSTGKPGEITIAHMPQKRDVTGLHNALGITYRAPESIFAITGARSDTSDGLTTSSQSRPSTRSRQSTSIGSRPRTNSSPQQSSRTLRAVRSLRSLRKQPSATSLKRKDSAHSSEQPPPLPKAPAEPTLSVLYTPHGVAPSLLQSYASDYLAPMNALPFTALFHSFTQETNLWFLGGKVVTGAPGGVELVKRYGARRWISAHDEPKDNRGVSVKWIKTKRHEVGDVQGMLDKSGLDCAAVSLGCGGEVRILG